MALTEWRSIDEVSGNGNSYDFGARMYDPRLGRWWGSDPEEASYPNFSPYNFALNVPTNIIDPEGDVARDKNGNIIFTPSGKPEWRFQGTPKPNLSTSSVSGAAYRVQKGYIYTDNGKKVKVYLVNNGDVHNATQKYYPKSGSWGKIKTEKGAPPLNDKNGKPYDATTNCTGDCFLEGKFVLDATEINKTFLKGEGYTQIDGKPSAGDVGLYKDGKVVQHAERYEEGGTVNSKGGVTNKIDGQKPKSTWPLSYESYEVVNKQQDHTEIDTDLGSESDGVRTVSEKEFKSLKKPIKKEYKKNK